MRVAAEADLPVRGWNEIRLGWPPGQRVEVAEHTSAVYRLQEVACVGIAVDYRRRQRPRDLSQLAGDCVAAGIEPTEELETAKAERGR